MGAIFIGLIIQATALAEKYLISCFAKDLNSKAFSTEATSKKSLQNLLFYQIFPDFLVLLMQSNTENNQIQLFWFRLFDWRTLSGKKFRSLAEAKSLFFVCFASKFSFLLNRADKSGNCQFSKFLVTTKHFASRGWCGSDVMGVCQVWVPGKLKDSSRNLRKCSNLWPMTSLTRTPPGTVWRHNKIMNKFYCGEEEHRTEIRTRFTLQKLAFSICKTFVGSSVRTHKNWREAFRERNEHFANKCRKSLFHRQLKRLIVVLHTESFGLKNLYKLLSNDMWVD